MCHLNISQLSLNKMEHNMKRIIKVTAWVFSLLLFLIAQNSLSPLAKDYISGDLVYADSYDQVQDTGNDYIVLKDGRTLRCRIISIADEKIKVKLFDSQLIWEFGDEIQKRLIQQIKSNNEENIKRSQNAGEVSRKREYFGLAFLF